MHLRFGRNKISPTANDSLLRVLVEHSPTPIAIFDRDMRPLASSRRWASHCDLFPEIPDRWKQASQRSLTGTVESGEDELCRRTDGGADRLRWQIRPWRDGWGEIGGVIVFSEVIPECTREAPALCEIDPLSREAFEDEPIGAAIVGKDFRIRKANKALCDLLGYSQEELKALSFADFTHPEDVNTDGNLAHRLFQGEIGNYQIEKRLISKQGKCIWAHLTAGAIRDPEGRILHGLRLVEDITDRKRGEARLLESQKLDAVGRLAGGLAHDFNNLMMIVTGNGQLMLYELGESDPMRREILEINKAGERAGALTRQLLAFSRKQVLRPEVVDLNAIIVQMENMLRQLTGANIEMISVLEPGLGRVAVDTGQIQEVILNLASNARDAMPHGGKLIFRTENVVLDQLSCEMGVGVVPGAYVMLAVSDTGTGMNDETRAHIFEPFFTTKGRGKGTGLGLATVYGTVKQSGGDVWVYSDPNQGTTFKVYLPRIAEKP